MPNEYMMDRVDLTPQVFGDCDEVYDQIITGSGCDEQFLKELQLVAGSCFRCGYHLCGLADTIIEEYMHRIENGEIENDEE